MERRFSSLPRSSLESRVVKAPRAGAKAPAAPACPLKSAPPKKTVPRSQAKTKAPPAKKPRTPAKAPARKPANNKKKVAARPAVRLFAFYIYQWRRSDFAISVMTEPCTPLTRQDRTPQAHRTEAQAQSCPKADTPPEGQAALSQAQGPQVNHLSPAQRSRYRQQPRLQHTAIARLTPLAFLACTRFT